MIATCCGILSGEVSILVVLGITKNKKGVRLPTAHQVNRYRCFLPNLAGLANNRLHGARPSSISSKIPLYFKLFLVFLSPFFTKKASDFSETSQKIEISTWRPVQLASSQNMNMQMWDSFARDKSVINDNSESVIESAQFCNFWCCQHQMR